MGNEPPSPQGGLCFLATLDYIVLLFQLVLAQVILPPVKLSPSHSITWTLTLPQATNSDQSLTLFILGSSAYSSASKAFVFSLYNAKGYNPVKLTQYQNQQYAMYRCSSYGPIFGAGCGHDIYISNNAGNSQNSYTRCGCTYTTPSGYSTGDCGFFTGGPNFSPTDIEVFYETGN